jgi:long-chain acyl-CoA synthetase
VNLAHFLARSARVFPGRAAVASGERVLVDYGTLGRRCAAMAWALRTTLGLEPGDRVGLLMTNAPEYVEILWTAWWAGLAVVPVNAKLHPKEAEYILDHSGARVCFVTPDLAGPVSGLERIIVAGSEEYRGCAPARTSRRSPTLRPDDLAVALLHERHDRTAEGRDDHAPQFAGDDALLLRRRR